jgi:magnesium-transporting ATPase (P-type)
MHLLGAVGIEDELQEGVPQCIDLISRAGVNMWMITGDKPETAVAIGRMCGLLRPQHELEMMVKVTKGETLRLRLAELLQFFEKKKQHCGDGSDFNLFSYNSWSNLKFFSWNAFRNKFRSG